jgi:hypothetical protein
MCIPAPVDQTKEYDRAIAILKMSIEDEVMLSERDFHAMCWTIGTGNRNSSPPAASILKGLHWRWMQMPSISDRLLLTLDVLDI